MRRRSLDALTSLGYWRQLGRALGQAQFRASARSPGWWPDLLEPQGEPQPAPTTAATSAWSQDGLTAARYLAPRRAQTHAEGSQARRRSPIVAPH